MRKFATISGTGTPNSGDVPVDRSPGAMQFMARALRGMVATLLVVLMASADVAADGDGDAVKPRISVLIGGPAVDADIDATAEIIRRRLDTLGLAPSVLSGGGGLQVDLDRPDNVDAVMTVITTPGHFAIHAAGEIVQTCPARIEPGKVCMPTIEPRAPFVIVTADPVLSGTILAKAIPITGDNVVPQVAIQMTKQASDVFAQFTKAMTGGRIAFAVDGRILTAPRILGQITSGAGVLAGPGVPAPVWAAILTHPPLPGRVDVKSVKDLPSD